jgi:hypothetical protein
MPPRVSVISFSTIIRTADLVRLLRMLPRFPAQNLPCAEDNKLPENILHRGGM